MRTAPRTATRRRSLLGFLLVLVVMGSVASASPAWAHGGGETEEGYLLVQQALGHLLHDSTSYGIEASLGRRPAKL